MKCRWVFIFVPILLVFWLLNTSRPGRQVEGCLIDCSVKSSRSDESLRVVSLNMLHGFPKFENLEDRLEIIIQELIRLDPDIVMLQEVPWTLNTGNAAELIAGRLGMNHVYLRANGNRWAIGFEEGEAVLSRYPISQPEFIELQPRAGLFEHRVALHVVVTTFTGEIGLYVTHLTNGDEQVNLEQSESLVEFVTAEDMAFAIIAGDFNAQPGSSQIQALSSTWIDAFSGLGTERDSYTCCNEDLRLRENNPKKRIDYIFISPGVKTPAVTTSKRVFSQSYNIDNGWLWASDHIGLEVILSLGD